MMPVPTPPPVIVIVRMAVVAVRMVMRLGRRVRVGSVCHESQEAARNIHASVRVIANSREGPERRGAVGGDTGNGVRCRCARTRVPSQGPRGEVTLSAIFGFEHAVEGD